MPASSSAISAHDSECRVPRSLPMKPCEVAYADSDAPACTDAPSELSMPAERAAGVLDLDDRARIASCASMSHGCHRSRSGNCAPAAPDRPGPAGSSSVYRAIAQACSIVLAIESGCRSAVLAEPLRLPKYTVTPNARSRVCSTVSTSPRRTLTLRPASMLAPTSASLAPAARQRRITSSARFARRSSWARLSSEPATRLFDAAMLFTRQFPD